MTTEIEAIYYIVIFFIALGIGIYFISKDNEKHEELKKKNLKGGDKRK